MHFLDCSNICGGGPKKGGVLQKKNKKTLFRVPNFFGSEIKRL